MNFDNVPDSTTLPVPKDRVLYFQQQVTQDTIGNLTRQILDINRHDAYLKKLYALYNINYLPAPIRLYIDSYGGSVYQCLGVIGTMNSSDTPIHTYVTGVAMSCGFMMAIHGHKRFAYKTSTFMYHQISSIAWGKLAEMQESVVEAGRLQKIVEDMVLAKTKISLFTLKENFEHKIDWYMTADEALTNGCLDEIIG